MIRQVSLKEVINSFVNTNDSRAYEDLDGIITYLKSGNSLLSALQVKACPTCNDLVARRGYTDGEWIWEAEVIHHVQKHHCRLPHEFLLHIRENNYSCRQLSDQELGGIITSLSRVR